VCWSAESSAVFVVVGGVATGLAWHRDEAPAIWVTLGYFTAMEALQVAGYGVLDACGTPANRAVTGLSYLHIVFQPFFINAFAMALVPAPVRRRVRVWVVAFCALSAAVMLAQFVPNPAFGSCVPGAPLCGEMLCTVSGTWHIAWLVPYNGLLVPIDQGLGMNWGFPTYLLAAFGLPLVYGAWRFVLLHLFAGPVLAHALTDNPNEMPAVWCLFSIAILLVALSPAVRSRVRSDSWWGVAV
jgi:hypothetical protein